MSGLGKKAYNPPSKGKPDRSSILPCVEKIAADPVEEQLKQLKKVEALLDRGATLEEAKVDLAKFFVQEYDHDSSRHLIQAGKDEVKSNIPSMLTSAAAAALSGIEQRPANPALPAPKSTLYARAEKIDDLHSCPDEDFRLQVSVTRRSLKIIFDAVKSAVNNDFEYNDLLMLIWYLSSDMSTLEEVASVFEIPDADAVLQRLTEIAAQLLGLQKNAKMNLPSTEFEEDDIVECFKRRTGVPDILGALGVFKLDCLDGTNLCVLSVCDHRHYFRHLSLYTDLETTSDIVRSSPIFERLIKEHPKRYTYLCPAEGYPTLPQLVPGLQPDEFDLFDEMPEFALRHAQVVNHLRTSIKETVSRFPKVNALETACPEIVTAAFMLHNFCIDTRDSSINYDDDLEAFFPPSSAKK